MSDDVGARYVHAAANRDFGAIKQLFCDDIEFLGATPAGAWHVSGWVETEQALENLFPENEKVTQVVEISHHDIPGRHHISYRLRGIEADYGKFEYQHQAYYDTREGRIYRLRVLCSGYYRPD